MVKTHVLELTQPNSSGWDLGQDGKSWNGRNGRSGKLSHSNDVIGACICFNDVNVCGSAHCGCVVNGSVATYGSFFSIICSHKINVGIVHTQHKTIEKCMFL